MNAFELMDGALLVWLNDWRHPALTAGMGFVTWLGSLLVLLPLALAIGGWGNGSRHRRMSLFLPAAVLGAAGIAHLLKWTVDRERPDLFPSLVAMPADASFPSAHAMQVTAFVAAWLVASGSVRRVGPVLAGLLVVTAVGFSRLYLQVHFPSDVFFGIFGGVLWVGLLGRLPVWRRG